MATYTYDLFVIGAGSGGVRAARMAAGRGCRVGIAEERYLGGTCVNVGCVPKKLFVYASQFRTAFEHAKGYGWTVDHADFDWRTLLENKNREITRLNGIYGHILDKAGVERIEGHARLRDPHTIDIDGRIVTARDILIATGSWPDLPDIPGIEHAITSNEAFYFEALPKRVLIVGGGYIAVEFAGILHNLGVDVSLLYRGPLFLRGFDRDIRETLAGAMRARGMNLRFETNVARIDKDADGLVATLEDGSRLSADHVLFATGRRPLTRDLGLESCGVEVDAGGAIRVDRFSRTSTPNMYAVGDVTDRMNLTPVAIAEAMALVKTLCDDEPTEPDYRNVPSAVFSQPPVGTVGYTEEDAREAFGELDIYVSDVRPLEAAFDEKPERAMLKLVVERATQRVRGVHMVGPHAGDIIQGFAVALKCGATKAQFDATVGVHPTLAEEFVTMREAR